MRWRTAQFKNARVKRKFLFLPRSFNGETRWLEFANIKEEFIEYVDFGDALPGMGWRETGFAEQEDL